jgi:hypothetical protein
MATFTETFEYDDADLDGVGGWVVDNDASSDTGIETLANYATNFEGSLAAVAYQATTVPTTATQEVSAYVTSSEQTANSYVDIGVGGKTAAAWADRILGVYARLYWLPSGERKVTIRHKLRDLGSGASDTEVASLTIMTSGGVEVSGYEGALLDGGDTKTFQHLRLILTSESSGLFAAVFLNNADDDHPILSAKVLSDWVEPNASDSTDFGTWWFGFGDPGGSFDRSLVVGQFAAGDYTERVRRRYAGAAHDNLSDPVIDDYITDEVRQIVNQLGDSAWFMRRTEIVSISTDAESLQTLDAKVKRPVDLTDSVSGRRFLWEFHSLDSSGACVIRFAGNPNYTEDARLHYIAHYEEMEEETDICPIPREHTEVVVIGACLRAAERDRNAALIASYMKRYDVLFRSLQRDQNRYADMQKARYRPRRASSSNIPQPIWRWGAW